MSWTECIDPRWPSPSSDTSVAKNFIERGFIETKSPDHRVVDRWSVKNRARSISEDRRQDRSARPNLDCRFSIDLLQADSDQQGHRRLIQEDRERDLRAGSAVGVRLERGIKRYIAAT